MSDKSEARALRQKAEAIVDLYVDWLFSLKDDAGWHGGSVLGRWADFLGQPPQGSGFIGFDRYEREIRYLKHVNHRTAAAIQRVDALTNDQRVAVLSDRAYRGRTRVVAIDPFRPESPVTITWTTERCAEELGISVPAYRKNISRGYQALEAEIEVRKVA